MTESTEIQDKPNSKRTFFQRRESKPYVDPYLAGALLGLVMFTSFFLTGNGLGASGGLNRVIVFFEDLVVPGHIDQTRYLLKMAGGVKNPLDLSLIHI